MQILSVGFLLVSAVVGVMSLDFVHHDNQAVQSYLQNVNTRYPTLTKLYSIGKSNNGHDLWVIAIGRDIDTYIPLRPHVKYIGNMHGNEVVSREVLLHLIEYYVTSYATNSTVKAFLDTTVVHIMATMNPDGYDISSEGDCDGIIGRYNAQNLDLNRNFPDLWHDKQQKPLGTETQMVMDWLPTYNFVLSANLHGGAMVANYPFDKYFDTTQTHGPSICPDDDIFRFLSLTYSTTHATMAITNGTECEGDFFLDGISNGADWYAVAGGMQDYNYLKHGIFEVTLEISCCKFPNASDLELYWEDNKEALISYLLQVHRGVKGIVTDENNNTIENVTLSIEGRELTPFMSRLHGEYYRVLLPGTYNLLVTKDKYKFLRKTFTVTDGVTHLDIQLVPELSPMNGALPAQQVSSRSLLAGALIGVIVACFL